MAASPQNLCEFIDASPSPYHVCATAAQRLTAAGYRELSEADAWPAAGKFFTVRAGSLIAWDSTAAGMPFRIVGAHTDSPNLRVKQHPDRVIAGWQVVALQPYGGAWLNSWLDRDLGISGRLSVATGGQERSDSGSGTGGQERSDSGSGAGGQERSDSGSGTGSGTVRHQLVRIDDPILRVPQLAIHLSEDRKGVSLDPQRHLNAVWGVGDHRSFLGYVAAQAGVDESDVLGFDLMTHDLAPSRITGADGDFVSAPRLDNQATCYAGLEALLAAPADRHVPVLALFDHEEVGSQSDHGAQSDLLSTVLERITLADGGGREDFLRRLSESMVASGDMAHATHPNYPERHEPGHQIAVNGGPVLKVQPNLRYATDGRTAAAFALACRQAGVPLQRYEHRADLPCGSTIGPMTAAGTGIPTVDVGAAQLAMHSAREVMGAHDVAAYAAALRAFLAPA
ncbi:M18 family aminopeptidase [Mycobacterium sp. MBM]|nr:M18 family aminopeptidase [Mycobacterium sp. MBM]